MLTEEQKKQISDALDAYVVEKGISYNTVAKGCRVSATYFSYIKKGDYFVPSQHGETVIPDSLFTKIARYVEFSLEKESWKRVMTAETIIIEQKLIEAKENGTFKAIIGASGCGKTYTVDHFVAREKHSHVYRITDGCLHKVSDVISDLTDEMRLMVKGKTQVGKLRAIENKISKIYSSGGTPLIIIDEAENLKLPVFGFVKQLYDILIKNGKKEKMCGIVLIGTEQLTRKIEKMSVRDKEGMPQFTRRIKAGVELIDHREWYKDKGFVNYVTELTGEKDIVTLLKGMANNYGEVNDYLQPAMRNADKYGEPFTLQFFKEEYRVGTDN